MLIAGFVSTINISFLVSLNWGLPGRIMGNALQDSELCGRSPAGKLLGFGPTGTSVSEVNHTSQHSHRGWLGHQD